MNDDRNMWNITEYAGRVESSIQIAGKQVDFYSSCCFSSRS